MQDPTPLAHDSTRGVAHAVRCKTQAVARALFVDSGVPDLVQSAIYAMVRSDFPTLLLEDTPDRAGEPLCHVLSGAAGDAVEPVGYYTVPTFETVECQGYVVVWEYRRNDPTEGTKLEDVAAAARFVSERVADILSASTEEERDAVGISQTELTRLEVILDDTRRVVNTISLDPIDRALLQAAIDTAQAQVRSPRPDRSTIGRALRNIAAAAGGFMVGVAANYLTDLLRAFGVPWPR